MRWLVKLACPAGARVLDPFCGTGTTGIACALEGRRFAGIDLSSEYLNIAARRLEDCEASLK
jgi:site-specific DNA-methyltransferase (adenine-specific)